MPWPPTDKLPKRGYSKRSQSSRHLLCCEDGSVGDGNSPATFSSPSPHLRVRQGVDLRRLPGDHDVFAVPLMPEPVTALPSVH